MLVSQESCQIARFVVKRLLLIKIAYSYLLVTKDPKYWLKSSKCISGYLDTHLNILTIILIINYKKAAPVILDKD